MQADSIPDWAIYILLTPFVPIAGFVHYSLGILQIIILIGATLKRLSLSRKRPDHKLKLIRTVYFPFFLVLNTGVVVWGILTDPAL